MQNNEVKSVITKGRMRGDSLHLLFAWWPAVFLLLLFPSQPAHAQYSASLQGAVADAQGSMIPGATLTLTDKETNRRLQATSNRAFCLMV
jgi:hypothetical protein